MKSYVRAATELDAMPCLVLAERYMEEAGEYSGLSFDPDTAVSNMLGSVNRPDHLFLVAVSGREVVGMLWAVCSIVVPWSSDLVALDQILYVVPELRGSHVGIRLLNEYVIWAESLGAKEIRLSVASGVHEEKTGRLYNKLGYSHLGSQYRRKICH